ncbi:spore coat U domain-containing protein [Luteimonas aestuarii]|uniref:Spore coat U domain-containing protein n=1 Tax=Luteimonas aestuarii TaxID=453837 RepID=A0A4R5TY01_9GAMM|nr:spore coat U domain-containing protein [Luteimonas aestuarii]TDK26078.1 spore coat U domain-containing protein [Luteimonas aestuarii]
MKIRILAATFALLAGTFATSAFAQSASTTFDVTLTITSVCTIDTPAATDVAFGSHPSTATAIEAVGQLNVNCTPGTAYAIALDAGLNAGGGGIASRAMANNGDLVPYQLYQDAGRSIVWGDTIDTNTVAGIGNGAVQQFPVYGLVPSANFPAASYVDTVTATITY